MADGTTAAEAAAALHAGRAWTRSGVNCGSGPIAGIEVLEQMAGAAAGTPLLVMPNAGLAGPRRRPVRVGRRARLLRRRGATLPGRRARSSWVAAAARRPSTWPPCARPSIGSSPADGLAGSREADGENAAVGAGPPDAPATIAVARRLPTTPGADGRGPAAHGPRDRAGGGSLRRQRRDRPAAHREHRAHAAVGRAHPRRRRRPRQHQRQRHGPRAHGRHGRGLRHPARPRPRGRSSTSRPATATSWHSSRSCWALMPWASATSWPSPATRRRVGDYPGGTGIWDIDSVGLIGILVPPQPRRGPGRAAHRRARGLHHRLRPRPHGRRPRSRARAPGRQDRGRRAAHHDAAHLRRRPVAALHGARLGALGRPAAAAGAAGRAAAAHRAPCRVPPQRGARHHHPG